MTSGERWTAWELDALRAGHFAPQAWVRFLGTSLRRAAETRRARPQLANQARSWSVIGLGSGLALCMASPRVRLAAPRPGRFVGYWLGVSAMLEWHLGMVEGPGGEPREHLAVSDALTMLRLWSIPFLGAQGDTAESSRHVFTALVSLAGATDVLDGLIARRVGTTRLGRDLDKIADALTILVSGRAARKAGWTPAGPAWLVTIRGALPVAVVATTYFRTGRRPAIDSSGASRRLAAPLLGGLAAAPFLPRAASVVTSTASVVALILDRQRASLGGSSAAAVAAISRPGRCLLEQRHTTATRSV